MSARSANEGPKLSLVRVSVPERRVENVGESARGRADRIGRQQRQERRVDLSGHLQLIEPRLEMGGVVLIGERRRLERDRPSEQFRQNLTDWNVLRLSGGRAQQCDERQTGEADVLSRRVVDRMRRIVAILFFGPASNAQGWSPAIARSLPGRFALAQFELRQPAGADDSTSIARSTSLRRRRTSAMRATNAENANPNAIM